MMPARFLRAAALLACCGTTALVTGCVTPQSYDYSAYREARPRSILVMPPVNDSTAVEASYSVLSQLTLPLAESGYYVMPVSLVDETFHQNGLHNPAEMEAVPTIKLRKIFGADAALYIHVKNYGTSYKVINSASIVTADAKLVDLRSGKQLWTGTATASSEESRTNVSGGGLIGLLVIAVVHQVIEQSTDASHDVAAVTGARLLGAGRPSGVLYGPRSPQFGKD